MDCPFCGKEMKVGKILSGTQWVEDDRQDLWESVKLCSGLFENGAKAFFCPDCRQIVVPVPEIESTWDKIQQKIDAVGEKLETEQKERETRRTEKQKKAKKKKFEGKDPWEL